MVSDWLLAWQMNFYIYILTHDGNPKFGRNLSTDLAEV